MQRLLCPFSGQQVTINPDDDNKEGNDAKNLDNDNKKGVTLTG